MSRAMNILVLQGGGALGAYQAGVYQALHEASSAKRRAEAARHAKNTRKLAKLVQKTKPRTEVALPAEVLAGRK